MTWMPTAEELEGSVRIALQAMHELGVLKPEPWHVHRTENSVIASYGPKTHEMFMVCTCTDFIVEAQAKGQIRVWMGDLSSELMLPVRVEELFPV